MPDVSNVNYATYSTFKNIHENLGRETWPDAVRWPGAGYSRFDI